MASSIPKPEPLLSGPGAGKGPSSDALIDQAKPPEGIPASLQGAIATAIATKPPIVVPMATLGFLDLFVEPVSRKAFVILFVDPTKLISVCINIPCGYPLILPFLYPVTLVGKGVGAVALSFINPSLDSCFGTETFDTDKYIQPPIDIDSLAAPIPASLKPKIPKVPTIFNKNRPGKKPAPVTEEEFEIFVEDALADFEFELEIIT